MPNGSIALDRVFHALSDPTRRSVLERLGRGPAPVGELAAPFRMALPSFMQHIKVLEDCGLVTSRKEGRVRTVAAVPEPLEEAAGWLAAQRSLWNKRLDQLDELLIRMSEDDR